MTNFSCSDLYNKKAEVRTTETVLYADVLFLIDFSMDFLSLYAVGKLYSLNMKPLRICIAAFTGALYGVAAVIFFWKGIVGAIGTVLCSFLMALTAFSKKEGIVKLIGITLSVWGCSALIGGFMTIFASLWANTGMAESSGMSLLAASIGLAGFGRILKKNTSRGYAELKIEWKGRECTGRALIDSGNLLTEPLSGLPVILICFSYAEKSFGRTFCDVLHGGPLYDRQNMEDYINIRAVPLRKNGKTEILYGFLCNNIQIRKENITMKRKAVVCVDFETENYAGCGILLPAALL